MEDASWLTATELQKYGVNPKSLRDDSFLPWEFDAGASRLGQQCESLFTCYGQTSWISLT